MPFQTDLVVEVVGGKEYKLTGPFVYVWPGNGGSIVVPAGFQTDFASIPQYLRWLITGHGDTRRPAVIHDYLYRTSDVGRKECDKIFLDAMKEEGVSQWKRKAMYYAVRMFARKK